MWNSNKISTNKSETKKQINLSTKNFGSTAEIIYTSECPLKNTWFYSSEVCKWTAKVFIHKCRFQKAYKQKVKDLTQETAKWTFLINKNTISPRKNNKKHPSSVEFLINYRSTYNFLKDSPFKWILRCSISNQKTKYWQNTSNTSILPFGYSPCTKIKSFICFMSRSLRLIM